MAGRIASYNHSDNVSSKGGSLVEVCCKTDFGSKTPEMISFASRVAKLVYGFQTPTWEELIALHPEIEDSRQLLSKKLGEPVVITQIMIMNPSPADILDKPELYLPYKEYTFFYHNTPFSQWNRDHSFIVDGVTYNCAEQYMMASKARMFEGDAMTKKVTEYCGAPEVEVPTTLGKIMAATHPREQKALGREVKNFDKAKWDAVARDIVYKGNEAKFSQNADYMAALMATKGTVLVEASPTDDIWGIKIGLDDARKADPKNWKGTNWLGEVLTKLRDNFIKQHEEFKTIMQGAMNDILAQAQNTGCQPIKPCPDA